MQMSSVLPYDQKANHTFTKPKLYKRSHINTMSRRSNSTTEYCVMATRRILVILIILYQHTIPFLGNHGVNGSMNMLSNYHLFRDFLEANKLNYGILTTCGIGIDDGGGGVESKNIANLMKLRNVNTRISFSFSLEDLNKLVLKDSFATGIYLNSKCEKSESILKMASANKLFNSTQKWLIVWERNNGSIKDEQEVVKILGNFDINLNSNVNIATEG